MCEINIDPIHHRQGLNDLRRIFFLFKKGSKIKFFFIKHLEEYLLYSLTAETEN